MIFHSDFPDVSQIGREADGTAVHPSRGMAPVDAAIDPSSIGGPSIPVLHPIETQILLRPVYDNRRLHSFAEWMTDNEQALQKYFDALNTLGGGPPDWIEWCVTQHDIQQILSRGATLSQLEPVEAV